MSEYNENNFENREQMYRYNGQNANGYPAPTPQMPKKKKSGSGARTAKKIGAIALSAVLFGGVASATFIGVNAVAGYTPASVKAAAQNDTASAQAQTAASDTAAAQNAAASVLQTTALPGSETANKGNLDVTDIATAVMPSIVSITNKSVQEVMNYFSLFGYGVQSQPVETESCGSGIIIGKNDTELLIVTNYHVVENADTLSACFIDNQAYEANIKGTDSENDLAVIAVPLESISADTMAQIKVASIGDSNALLVGQQVVAIGNALGYGQSVTTGIVSATDRSFGGTSNAQTADSSNDSANEPTYIQTDAAINPGNSGGALVNMNGEVIGINSAKMASTEVEGMGYAIPVSRVSDIIETLMNETTRTKVSNEQKASIGISGISVDSSVNQAYGIPTGVYIADVTKGGAAEAAGLVKGEVITAFDGKAITDIEQLKDLLQYYAAGETIEVTVQIPGSNGYTEEKKEMTLGHAEDTTEQSDKQQESQIPALPHYDAKNN